MDVVSCCRILDIRSFVLEVRSWSHNDVPVNLYQMNVILCPDQKGQSPKAQLSPSKVLALTKGRESSAGSSFRARFPHSAQLSSLREPGTQPNRSSVSLGCPNRETSSHKLRPRKPSTASRSQRMGESFIAPQGLGQG